MPRFRTHLSVRRALLAGGFLLCLAVGAVVASATPPSGVTAGPVVRGTVAESVVIGTPVTRRVPWSPSAARTRKVGFNVRGGTFRGRVPVAPQIMCAPTKPCDTAFQQVTIAPGGASGWHTRPGPTFVAIAQGEGTLYHAGPADSGCVGQKYAAGTGFFLPVEDVRTLRNEGSVPLVVQALFVVPPGTPNTALRIDRPQPPNCPDIP